MAAVLRVDHKAARVEEETSLGRDFQLSRQKVIVVRIKGNSSGSNEKWPDLGSILKNFLMRLDNG